MTTPAAAGPGTAGPAATGLHGDALAVLERWSAPDAEQEALRRAYVDHLRRHDDGVRRSCHPAHLTAGVLVLDPDARRVLLNLHRKAGRWFHFGGHLEPGDTTLAGAAAREGVEESGLPRLDLGEAPVHLSRHVAPFCIAGPEVTHLDVRYAARVPADAPVAASEESLDVRWFDLDDLPALDPDMRELIALARR